MSIVVRTCGSPAEVGRAATILHYFGRSDVEAWLDRYLRYFEVDRMHAAFASADPDASPIAGAGALSFDLSIPGGVARAAGITLVGVLPTHRRRGALRALMRAQLDDIRRRGEPLACLWASEETIYDRFGYGPAAWGYDMSLPKTHAKLRPGVVTSGEVRLVTAEEALQTLPQIYDRVRRGVPGMLGRSHAWWEHRRLLDAPDRRAGNGPLQHVVIEDRGRDVGYALYRIRHSLEHMLTTSRLDVVEAMGVTPEATRAVWAYLLDIDWIATIDAHFLPTDHVLLHTLAHPRSAKLRLLDTLWVRLVDVSKALAARTYVDHGSVVVEVADAFCPSNEGRYRVGERAGERTDEPADVALDVAALGSLYLGGSTAAQLAEADLVRERRDGGIERLDALLRTPRAPWCPEVF